jgi:pSer/pThr/pTyr-binding forkhead associated (FHA) protein
MKHYQPMLDSCPSAGLFVAVGGLAVLREGAQSPLSGWAIGFLLVGALGLILLVALILVWQVARPRRPLPVAETSVAPEPLPERPPAPDGHEIWGALWVRQEGTPVQVFQLVEPTVSIGRDPVNGLCLSDEQLSGRHAELRHEGGAAVLYDLGGPGGTSVNHTPVVGSRRLSPGDVINLGAAELVYRPPSKVSGAGGRLLVTRGQSQPAQARLASRPGLYIGTNDACDLVIQNDPGVSPQHAHLQRTASGHEIVDLESATGILVNGRPVSRAHLRPGDRIRLGATEFLYQR